MTSKADLVFCENSGADLSEFRDAAQRAGMSNSVRFLSFTGNSGAERFGKGHGEIEMLKYAFENSAGALPVSLYREGVGTLCLSKSNRNHQTHFGFHSGTSLRRAPLPDLRRHPNGCFQTGDRVATLASVPRRAG